jgi:adenylate cyclase
MDHEFWHKVEEVFQTAVERAPEERHAFLDEFCRDDADLRRQVDLLLANDAQAKSFLEMRLDDEHAELVLTMEGVQERAVRFSNVLMIGRSSACQVVLDDPQVSRNHAEIRLLAGRYRLSDLGSVNGTWLNGQRITVPSDLEDGDEIQIGRVMLRFTAPPVLVEPDDGSGAPTTAFLARTECIVVLVADIRNYTGMSEVLPSNEFSQIVSEWFREASDVIERHKGMIDKFIGDTIMACWAASKPDLSEEINQSLQTARELISLAVVFSRQFSSRFPGQTFQVGIGLNAGLAIQGNVGTRKNQSFTVVGDSVNVAFRLQTLTKEKMVPVIVSESIKQSATNEYHFEDLGEVILRGRKDPVSIWALNLQS